MNCRDELARDIFIADNARADDPGAEWDAHCEAHRASCHGEPFDGEYAYGIADGLLDAGYRKPRIVSTKEELKALLVGSVVLSKRHKTHRGMAVSFQQWAGGSWHRGGQNADTHPDNFLPAVVLWEPEQP